MVGEDFVEGVLVLRLDERVDGAGGSLAKASSVGAKTVKGPGLLSVSTRPPALTAATRVCVDRRVDCVLDDGLGGVHGGAADGWVFLRVGAERGDGQSGYVPGLRGDVFFMVVVLLSITFYSKS